MKVARFRQRAYTGSPMGFVGKLARPIGSIVKFARIVHSTNVVLTIYYVKMSDEQHSEPLPCFKVLHSRLYLV